jgi:ketosteroid isomerase-like protein
MKTRLLLAVAGLAIGFALPTFAQQTKTPDPKLREEILALAKKFDDAYNNGDGVALAALYTEDGVEVANTGPSYGPEALQKHYLDMFQKVHLSNHLNTVDQYSPRVIGTAANEIWATGAWSATVKGQNFGPGEQKGYWSMISVREGDTWKARLLTWNVTPAPANK